MLRGCPVSLNKLSYDHVVAALDAVRAGAGPPSEPPVIDHVYIDTGEGLCDNIYVIF
jgi:hypothetical protein